MKNIILLIALSFASLSQAAMTKIPGTMLGTGAVASQGATGKVDIQSVYFGAGADCETVCSTGTCTICYQVGNKITSVTWQTGGQYRVNGLDGTKYNCTGNGYVTGTGYSSLMHRRSFSASTYAYITAWVGGATANSANVSVTCIGNP